MIILLSSPLRTELAMFVKNSHSALIMRDLILQITNLKRHVITVSSFNVKSFSTFVLSEISNLFAISGYMAAGGSSSPFGRPPPSGGIGSGRAMFSGVTAKGGMPMAGGFGGRPPMAGGIGGMGGRKKMSKSKPDSNKKEKDDKLSTFDKLMSLVKRNGLWPASSKLSCPCAFLNLLFRGQRCP